MPRAEPRSRHNVPSGAASEQAADGTEWIREITGSNELGIQFSSGTRLAAEQLGQAAVVRKANDLVRLALFSEYRRSSIRRDTLMKRVIGKDGSRAFAIIFSAAQYTLRNTFGFELVEMRPRGTENPNLIKQAQELDRRSQNKRQRVDEASESHKSSSTSSAQAYILRSVLPASVRYALTSANENDTPPMIDWNNSAGELESMGLLFLLLSLILLSGRQAPEAHLRSCLAQLSLYMDRALPSALQTRSHYTQDETPEVRHSAQDATLDTFFSQMLRQGYLEKVRVQSDASSPTFEWRWGARAELEIGEKAIANFIVDLYSDGAKLESEGTANELLKRIERAVGTPLVE